MSLRLDRDLERAKLRCDGCGRTVIFDVSDESDPKEAVDALRPTLSAWRTEVGGSVAEDTHFCPSCALARGGPGVVGGTRSG